MCKNHKNEVLFGIKENEVVSIVMSVECQTQLYSVELYYPKYFSIDEGCCLAETLANKQ